jgi:hypothetical protein
MCSALAVLAGREADRRQRSGDRRAGQRFPERERRFVHGAAVSGTGAIGFGHISPDHELYPQVEPGDRPGDANRPTQHPRRVQCGATADG